LKPPVFFCEKTPVNVEQYICQIEGVHYPNERNDYAMVYDSARGVVVLFGGNPDSGDEWCLNDTWEY
jgi:hypothetical protein